MAMRWGLGGGGWVSWGDDTGSCPWGLGSGISRGRDGSHGEEGQINRGRAGALGVGWGLTVLPGGGGGVESIRVWGLGKCSGSRSWGFHCRLVFKITV